MGHWKVEVDKKGNVKVEGVDFKGNTCELPPGLLEAIGATAVEHKEEFYQQPEDRTVAAGRRA